MDVFDLLPSLADGELSQTSAPELVAAILRSRASGTLSIETGKGAEIRQYFRMGNMCGSAYFTGFHTLAQVLLANEWVNALDIDASRAEAQATGKRHGQVLVEKQLLTLEQLQAALCAQHQQNLGVLLALDSGHYELRGWEPPPAWSKEFQIDPLGPILRAFALGRAQPSRKRVLDWLGDWATQLSVDWPELSQRIELDAGERRAAMLLALPRKRDEFIRLSHLEPAHAEALLVTLLLVGAAESHAAAVSAPVSVTQPPVTKPPIPRSAPRSTPLSRPPPLAEPVGLAEPVESPVSIEPRLVEPDDLAEVRGEIEQALSASEPAPELTLELDEEDRPEASHQGFEYHAGRLEVAPSIPPRSEADAASSDERRRRMRAAGLRNLRGQTPSAPPAEALEGAVNEEQASATIDESRLPAPDRRFLEEVHLRAGQVASQDAYQRLGVARLAGTDTIRAAYLEAAKRFHPDHASAPGFEGLAGQLQTVFSAMKDAYDCLATPEARAQYDARLKGGGPLGNSPNRKDEAGLVLRMGEVLLKKRDFGPALAKLRRAVELDSNGDSMAALAWGLMCDPSTSPAGKEEAAALINKGLRATGISARTYYVAGVMWRSKDPASAAEAFRKALELEPNHGDASLELRLLEMRQGHKQQGGGVLSGLLFGKRK